VGSPKGGPTREFPLGGSPMGITQGGSPKRGHPNLASQAGSPKWGTQGDTPRVFPKRMFPKGSSKGFPQFGSTNGGP
jgi:hypothetical protein